MYRGGRNIKFGLRRAPVSILLDVMSWDPLYKEGVFDKCPESDFKFNHVAVLSGLRKDDVWIVRNSWGSQWGDNGYIYLPSGNPCGIQEEGIQPNLYDGTLYYD
jgi:hypothetical protein